LFSVGFVLALVALGLCWPAVAGWAQGSSGVNLNDAGWLGLLIAISSGLLTAGGLWFQVRRDVARHNRLLYGDKATEEDGLLALVAKLAAHVDNCTVHLPTPESPLAGPVMVSTLICEGQRTTCAAARAETMKQLYALISSMDRKLDALMGPKES